VGDLQTDGREFTEAEMAEEEAAFESTFSTDLEPEPEQAPEPAAEQAPEPEQQAPAEEPAKGPTIDDLMAAIEAQKQEAVKTRDKMFGKIGELQQKIDTARTSVSGLSPKAKENLEQEFPELAAMLFDQSAPEPQQQQS
jgi:hypothetical protein